MPNPFDDPDGTFLVLINSRQQHSLWPATIPVPNGWTRVYGAARRQSCLDYVEANWTDIRPVDTDHSESLRNDPVRSEPAA